MFLFLLLSPARLGGTRTKSVSWSVSELESGDLGGLAPLSLVSILSAPASSLGERGPSRPWLAAGEGGNMDSCSPPGTAMARPPLSPPTSGAGFGTWSTCSLPPGAK